MAELEVNLSCGGDGSMGLYLLKNCTRIGTTIPTPQDRILNSPRTTTQVRLCSSLLDLAAYSPSLCSLSARSLSAHPVAPVPVWCQASRS